MIKIIDIDRLFDKYIGDYVYKNIGKVKPEEIENKMPVLYEKFGDETLKELDGKTPNTFYKSYGIPELLECLKGHLNKGVSVSDFLCEAIIDKPEQAEKISEELLNDNSEEYTAYLMNFLSDMNAKVPLKRYLEFVVWDYPESVGELATEILSKHADEVKDAVIEQYKDAPEDKKERLAEILSNAKRDDRILDILVEGFVKNQSKLPYYCSLFVKYGDERVLPFLMQAISDEKISYADFEELRFTIEALGGEYEEKRDFSKDRFYKKIKERKPTAKN